MTEASQPGGRSAAWGFGWGTLAGTVLALTGLLLIEPDAAAAGSRPLGDWVATNLGHAAWLFGLVLTLYVVHLARLKQLLRESPDPKAVAELDQLSDVWIHLFVGIGVIWTAVGMRSALQTALGDTDTALTDSAGSVLQKMVDGGILLALTTTIVGGVGGYLMRLAKTISVGAALHGFYEAAQGADLAHLLRTVDRIETRMAAALGQIPSANGQGHGPQP